ncbi:MAG: four helix bundle protein [Candidatus Brocadiia bacterium]
MPENLDHENLDVYKLELSFIAWVTVLIQEARKAHDASMAEVCDQLDRSSLSSLLNTAEGNGKRQRHLRARYFDDARGSAAESAACLDAIVAKGAMIPERIQAGKEKLVRIVQMLTRMVERFSNTVSEREEKYNATAEDDDEDEDDSPLRSR